MRRLLRRKRTDSTFTRRDLLLTRSQQCRKPGPMPSAADLAYPGTVLESSVGCQALPRWLGATGKWRVTRSRPHICLYRASHSRERSSACLRKAGGCTLTSSAGMPKNLRTRWTVLCMLKTRKHRKRLAISVPSPYRRGHDDDSFRPRFHPRVPCSQPRIPGTRADRSATSADRPAAPASKSASALVRRPVHAQNSEASKKASDFGAVSLPSRA